MHALPRRCQGSITRTITSRVLPQHVHLSRTPTLACPPVRRTRHSIHNSWRSWVVAKLHRAHSALSFSIPVTPWSCSWGRSSAARSTWMRFVACSRFFAACTVDTARIDRCETLLKDYVCSFKALHPRCRLPIIFHFVSHLGVTMWW